MSSSSDYVNTLETCKRGELSPLEKLPTEILQHVYHFVLADRNTLFKALSLPRSSPFIGSKLGSMPVKEELVIRAFGRCTMGDDPLLSHFILDRPGLQDQLLNLKWVTWKMIMWCQRKTFMRLIRSKPERSSIVRRGFLGQLTRDATFSMTDYCYSYQCLELYRTFENDKLCWEFSNIRSTKVKSLGDFQFMVRIPDIVLKHIPHRLLRGPWTDEKVLLLEKLRESECTYIPITDLGLVQKAIESVIREGNMKVLNRLLSIKIAGLSWGSLDHLLPGCDQMRRVGCTLDHFRIAILEAGCNKTMVEALRVAGRGLFNHSECCQIGRWYEEKRKIPWEEWRSTSLMQDGEERRAAERKLTLKCPCQDSNCPLLS
ncbi:hypothetical protein MMC14_000005 [Varicellaria rhodocarpa]|nr:hypothetical protein [Varicellaria rhodocarpa]